jgi:hypothetical protein
MVSHGVSITASVLASKQERAWHRSAVTSGCALLVVASSVGIAGGCCARAVSGQPFDQAEPHRPFDHIQALKSGVGLEMR